MRKLINIIAILFMGVINNNCSHGDGFNLYGGLDIDEGRAILQKEDGSYLITGRTRSIGEGSDDFYLLKVDMGLDLIFEKAYGSKYYDKSHSIIEVNDSTYGLFGHSWNSESGSIDMNLTLVNDSGEFINRILFERKKRDLGLEIIKTSDNGYVLVGMVSEFDNYGQMIILKTDQYFNVIWENNFGEILKKDYGNAVIENENGYLLIGTYSGFYGMNPVFTDFQDYASIGLIQLDFEGNLLWKYSYNGEDHDFGYSISQVGQRIYALGSTRSEGKGSFDIILFEFNLDGELSNKYTYGGKGFEYGYKIISDSEDNLIIVGASNSNSKYSELYVLKVNIKGEVLFEKRFKGINSVYGYDIIENLERRYMITGSYKVDETNTNIFLFELDKNGNRVD